MTSVNGRVVRVSGGETVKNNYEIRGDITAIIIESPTHGRHEALVDTEDLGKVSQISSWRVDWDEHCKSYYVKGGHSNRQVRLHRYVLGVEDARKQADHIHHNTLDNRKSQLRTVTSSENAQNRRVMERSASGYPGVNWHKATGKWYARIGVGGKRVDLGCYSKLEDAVNAKKEAEKKYFKYKTSINEGT